MNTQDRLKLIQSRYVPLKKICNRYSVTKDGQVFDHKRGIYCPAHEHNRGYLMVNIRFKDKWKKQYVHRLVSQVHDKNFRKDWTINHKDGDKKNNHISNLECVPESVNQRHAFETGLKKGCIDKVKKLCPHCSTDFYVSLSYHKRGGVNACSLECAVKLRYTGEEVPCENCGKLKYKTKLDLKRTRRTFCEPKCMYEWRSKTPKKNW